VIGNLQKCLCRLLSRYAPARKTEGLVMAVNLSSLGGAGWQFFDNNGNPLSGGKLYTYVAGTSTPAPTYTSVSGATANPNPIILNSAGRPPSQVWLDNNSTYKFVLTTSTDILLWTMDNIPSIGSFATATIAELPSVPAAVNDLAYVTDPGRAGAFICRAGTAPSDPMQGIYVVSNTPNLYWERDWDGIDCPPEWFGGRINDAGFNNYNACMGALNVTGILSLGKGSYYSSSGLALPAYSVVRGQGALHTAIVVNNATDHLISQEGVFPGDYIGGANVQGVGLVRGVPAAIPANPADDKTQGHGLHFSMCSNPIVEDVYTYNNLAEVYVSNVLSVDFSTIRGINLTGGGVARWYGLWVDGASPIGAFGGPSPNPSARFFQVNMVGSGATQAYGYYFQGSIQDLWVSSLESAGCSKGIFIDNGSGFNCGDVHLLNPVIDGYAQYGIHVKEVQQGASLFILNPWVAGRSGATDSGIFIQGSHNVDIVGATGDGVLSTGVYMLEIENCSQISATLTANNYVTPCYMISASSCNVNVTAYKNIGGGGVSGNIIVAIGGDNTSLMAAGTKISQGWDAGIAIDATVDSYMLNVVGVDTTAVTARIKQASVAVTTQGNVGGNVIINPGAGAFQ